MYINADGTELSEIPEDLARRYRRVAQIMAAGVIRAAASMSLDEESDSVATESEDGLNQAA